MGGVSSTLDIWFHLHACLKKPRMFEEANIKTGENMMDEPILSLDDKEHLWDVLGGYSGTVFPLRFLSLGQFYKIS